MAAEVRPGGCERCGRTEDLHYHHWQFLCTECLEMLREDRVRAHDHAERVARIEAQEAGPPGAP